MSPEVLIYVQSIKHYFKTNTDAQKYFTTEGKEEVFFDNISEISQKNFEENGEPELSIFQFEEIRRKISNSLGKKKGITGAFMSFGNLGHASLN